MTSPSANSAIALSELSPSLSPDEITGFLVPPPQFDLATLESYRPDPDYPSQAAAVEACRAFIGGGHAQATKAGFFSRAKKVAKPASKPGLYLDGGFGVGKTHLLASLWHAASGRKYFGTFMQYTALVGALGYQGALEALRPAKLICIDEFELDDPGDTMVMTRLLRELIATGTRIAATSNTPPNALGEGRFAAADFLREIQAMSDNFETLRIDGLDYRRRSAEGHAIALDEHAYSDAVRVALDDGGKVSDDDFTTLVAHLGSLHPSKYIKMLDGLSLIGLSDVVVLHSQTDALRLVAFIDRVYDAQIPIVSTGVALDSVFATEMLDGGYRKKYLRAISRLIALTSSAARSTAQL